MKSYDVIIAGGGPAGLKCADSLKDSGLEVLLLEKEPVFGDKVCAGGLTRKDLSLLKLDWGLIEHAIRKTALYSRCNKSSTEAGEPLIFTVDRKQLGKWQSDLLQETGITIRVNARVTAVLNDRVIVNGTEEFGYRYLVGADGYNSIVRKYLDLPQKKKLIGIQYRIPVDNDDPGLEVHMHSHYFRAWYAWVFPHKGHIAVGCVCDPDWMPPAKLKKNFHVWLAKKGIVLTGARYESCPISYDFAGFQFGNLFLVGDAGGFASGLTGEGIYQALVSGEAAARKIMDPLYDNELLEKVIRYNTIQNRIMKIMHYAGPFRWLLQESIVLLMNNRYIKSRINSSFS